MRGAAKIYRGEYRTRYVYHAQMEPMNATAAVSPDGKSAEIWVGTQGPSALHAQVARLLQTDRANITFHQHFLGGGYGRRGAQEVVLDAVRLSKAVGKPVKLIWTREDDIAGGRFRPMTAHHIEAGVDGSGKVIAWHHRIVAESPIGFRRARSGGTPPRLDRVVLKGSSLPHYPIPNKLVEHVVEDARRAGVAMARRRRQPQCLRQRAVPRRDRGRPGQGPARVPARTFGRPAARAGPAARGRGDVGLGPQTRRARPWRRLRREGRHA